ncbi:hypothetical protein D3C87_1984790 [compost metagenome]
MAEFRVEIDEVDETEAAIGQIVPGRQRGLHHSMIAEGLDLLAGGAMGEDVADLADGHDLAALRRQPVEQRLGRRWNGEVLAVAGAGEALLG